MSKSSSATRQPLLVATTAAPPTHDRRDPRIRAGFAAPAGFAATLVAAAVMTMLHGSTAWRWDVGLVVTLVGVAGWFSAWTAALATAGFGWLMVDGFLENRYGVLQWHGRTDAVLLAGLLGCGLGVALLREAQIRGRRRAARKRLVAEPAALGPVGDAAGGRHG